MDPSIPAKHFRLFGAYNKGINMKLHQLIEVLHDNNERIEELGLIHLEEKRRGSKITDICDLITESLGERPCSFKNENIDIDCMRCWLSSSKHNYKEELDKLRLIEVLNV